MSTAVAGELSIQDALEWGRRELARSSSAHLDAQLLLAHALACSRVWVLSHALDLAPRDAVERYREAIARRKTGEPVAYIRGFVEWHGREFLVTRDVLIPRPETELLLERALSLIGSDGHVVAADIGTGSGAVAVELAHAPRVERVYATDTSNQALDVARINAKRLARGKQVDFLHGSLIEPVPEAPSLLVANLPYLSDDMMDALPVDVTFEPERALRAGRTGLELYEALLEQMHERGWKPALAVEIDPRQSGMALDMFKRWMPACTVWVEPDYAGLDRFILAVRGA